MEIVIVCIGGFHLDGIVKEQIKEVIEVAEQMSEEILQELEKSFCNTIENIITATGIAKNISKLFIGNPFLSFLLYFMQTL